MANKLFKLMLVLVLVLSLMSCAGSKPKFEINHESVRPGTQVTFKGSSMTLLGKPVEIGQKLPVTRLVDAETMKDVDLSQIRGQILFLSIVPSIDTKVCEQQTHYLGEEGDKLPEGVRRITISRDLPFAQKRFAEEAKLKDIQYLSDYKAGDFGRSTGLLVDDLMLLARSIIIVDHDGVVRYLQVVPEITQFPDMEKAFNEAVILLN